MTPPRLSICIATFKREGLLRETLTHLRQVCDDDVEIVISDNCSHDGTQETINSFAGRFRHFRAIRQTENRGAVANFAAAVALARGKYLYTLSDDDEIHIQGLQNAIAIMEQDASIVAVFGGYEEWIRASGKAFPFRFVEKRVDFPRNDKLAMFERFSQLWHPVCRSDIVHRYCSNEKRSFGLWELIGSLLERGRISVIPDLFYKHAHTEPRMEYELTEGWYHDAYRADFEIFVGRMGPSDPAELASFISKRVTPAYLPAMRFAKLKGDFVATRHFVLRARAYGLISEPDARSWEMQNLVGMIAERILAKAELMPAISEIALDSSPRLRALREHLAAVAPKYAIVGVSGEKSPPPGLRPNQLLVTYRYGIFESGAAVEIDPAFSVATEDLIETCRVTDQALELDVTGSAAIRRPATMQSISPVHGKQERRNDLCSCGSGKKYKHCHGQLN